MKASVAMVLSLATMACVPGGCRDRVKEISTPEALLKRQHEIWTAARQSLRTDRPNLNLLRSLHRFLCYRTPRRVAKAYTGADKTALLAKLRTLGEAYRKEVYAKLDLSGGQARLKRSVTVEQLREAFDKLDPDYRAFQAMVAGKP